MDPWSATNGEEAGRGYSARDLEEYSRRKVVADLETRLPGVVGQITAAILSERAAQEDQKRLRQQIQDIMPGDAVVHAFVAAQVALQGKLPR